MKRKRQDHVETVDTMEKLSTPNRRRKAPTIKAAELEIEDDNGNEPDDSTTLETPTRSRRGRPPGSQLKKNRAPTVADSAADSETPFKTTRKPLFATPIKNHTILNDTENDLPIVRNADRSARRKSARTLIEPTAIDALSDEEDFEEDDLLARKIWEADVGGSTEEQDEAGNPLEEETAATPSKGKRGRRRKSPSPPQNLPPHEQYFWQSRPGKVKTSNNTLSNLSLLTHEQYNDRIGAYDDPHASSYEYLHLIHSRSFPQWRFEFSQSFNLCLHGYGSKRELVTAFANYLCSSSPAEPPKIFIANGYTQTLTLRHLLTQLATMVFNCTSATLPSNLGSQPREMLTVILEHLRSRDSEADSPYYIFINSLDAPPLRRTPIPSLLASLAASPHIHLLATCDTPNFPLLWPTTLRDQYNFLFHDTTTYLSYADAEIPSVIDSVNELLGRSGRAVKGKEGVGFVLRSLPENARNLYRVLIAEILTVMDDDDDDGGGGGGGSGRSDVGVEYKVLYQKVVEEFICSNEMGFRQMLKEFYDHQMIVSRRDAGGTELLGVPWRRQEMEAILEDLVL